MRQPGPNQLEFSVFCASSEECQGWVDSFVVVGPALQAVVQVLGYPMELHSKLHFLILL